MRDIALRLDPPSWRHRYRWELLWVAFAVANYVAIIVWPSWKVIPFHFVWISLALLYGFRVWPLRPTLLVLACVMVASWLALGLGPFSGALLWGELIAVPLMAAMFLAMVWHARRHVDAQRVLEQRAEEHRSLLASQERFVHDASHELRTPVTIARGHLELLRGRIGRTPEIEVALDELARIDAITERLLLLAAIDQPDFVRPVEIELELLLEELFMRWSEAAPRSWRLGSLAQGSLLVDPERLRVALDALIENAIKYSEPSAAIELCARREGATWVSIEVHDEGRCVPAESLERIFERFARADLARTRAAGGVGLGLTIVDAIVKAHGGTATVTNTPQGPSFALHLPRFTPVAVPGASDTGRAPAVGARLGLAHDLRAPTDADPDRVTATATPVVRAAPRGRAQ